MAADLASGELQDLYEAVTVDGTATQAMTEIVGVESVFDDLGGPQDAAVREFKFDAAVLDALKLAIRVGMKIEFAGDVYDVNHISKRPGFPQLAVRGTLRPGGA